MFNVRSKDSQRVFSCLRANSRVMTRYGARFLIEVIYLTAKSERDFCAPTFGLENRAERAVVSGAYMCQFSKASLRNEQTNITVVRHAGTFCSIFVLVSFAYVY